MEEGDVKSWNVQKWELTPSRSESSQGRLHGGGANKDRLDLSTQNERWVCKGQGMGIEGELHH